MNQRNDAIDALRGFAIITMILSGTIAYGDVLPTWMFHAQVPPPNHVFNPALPGITWVDLVFPFFLFSMGAAMPLALSKGFSWKKVLIRFILLAFLAIFFQHVKQVWYTEKGWLQWFIPMIGFVVLAIVFTFKNQWIKFGTLLFGLFAIHITPYNKGIHFDLYRCDIIILVLANMALFGSIIWWYTKNNLLARLAILPLLMGLFLGKEFSNSWQSIIFEKYFLSWLINPYFLKYLFIIIPGTIVGDWLLQQPMISINNQNKKVGMGLIAIILIGLNVYCLFERMLVINLFTTLGIAAILYYWSIKTNQTFVNKQLLLVGGYLLLLGLCFEAFENGIKKDHSTYSYYFVTSGLAMYVIFAFISIPSFSKLLSPIGQNPLLAYVLGTLFITPLLGITGLKIYWDGMNTNVFTGVMKGISFTATVCLLTAIASKYKWYWKS